MGTTPMRVQTVRAAALTSGRGAGCYMQGVSCGVAGGAESWRPAGCAALGLEMHGAVGLGLPSRCRRALTEHASSACARRAGSGGEEEEEEEPGMAVMLHEDKKYYPSAEEVFGADVETLVMDEDAQPLEVPIVAPVKQKKFETLEAEPVATTYRCGSVGFPGHGRGAATSPQLGAARRRGVCCCQHAALTCRSWDASSPPPAPTPNPPTRPITPQQRVHRHSDGQPGAGPQRGHRGPPAPRQDDAHGRLCGAGDTMLRQRPPACGWTLDEGVGWGLLPHACGADGQLLGVPTYNSMRFAATMRHGGTLARRQWAVGAHAE